jgi:hypothetical protein
LMWRRKAAVSQSSRATPTTVGNSGRRPAS